MTTIDEIRERLRSRIHAIFNRVSRWLDSLFGVKRRMTWRQKHFYHTIDTRLPRYEIVNGQWEKVSPVS